MKLLTVVGARPQFIKAAAVTRRKADSSRWDWTDVLVHTGQHFDENMSAVFFDELGIPTPDYNLGIGGGTHAYQTGQMMIRLEEIFASEQPDMVLVYGDTNSTLAGALCAAKGNIPLVHVEAGLRSSRKDMAEEINRIVTDRLSDLLFCPTETAVGNLAAEGRNSNVHLVGDVMYDIFRQIASETEPSDAAAHLGMEVGEFVIVTLHRPENVDDPMRLKDIIHGIGKVASNWSVLLPLHPRTRKRMEEFELDLADRVTCVDPLPYRTLVPLLRASVAVITDSGGLQKEAAFAETPCVTIREETEWVETLAGGWNRLSDPKEIVQALDQAISAEKGPPPSYGNGDAAGAILDHISSWCGL